MKLIVLAALAAVASAKCPASCSGHGTCGAGERCACEDGYTGVDCNNRQCPFGVSDTLNDVDAGIIPQGRGLGGMHPYVECSGRGECDASTGTCKCFTGYEGRGCRRATCPGGCSEHGKCYSSNEIDRNFTATGGAVFNTLFRDYLQTRHCKCDRGYKGLDCSERICPKGDDPVTDCSTDVNGAAHEMIQRLYVRLAGAPTDAGNSVVCAGCVNSAATCVGNFECNAGTHSYCTEKTRWYVNEAEC